MNKLNTIINYPVWSPKKFWIVLAVVFFAGMLIAPKGQVVTKEVPTEKVITKEVPAKFDDSNWRTLKMLDDAALGYAVENLSYCAKGFEAIAENDIEALNLLLPKITATTPKIADLATERQAVLIRLGY